MYKIWRVEDVDRRRKKNRKKKGDEKSLPSVASRARLFERISITSVRFTFSPFVERYCPFFALRIVLGIFIGGNNGIFMGALFIEQRMNY